MSAADPACPKCAGAVERVLHAPAVQFKGSGWYVTDYAKSGQSSAKSDSAKSDSKTGDKSEASTTKTESKGESKSESKSSGGSKD